MTDKSSCNPLLLGNQLCFPLYASARKIVAAYNPFLKEIGLTYPQYVTMMSFGKKRKSLCTTWGNGCTLIPAR